MVAVQDNKHMVREAVGVFDSLEKMEAAIDELEVSGFERRQISVLGSNAALEERFGKSGLRSRVLEDHPKAPRSPEVKREELRIAQGVLIGGGIYAGVIGATLVSGSVVGSAGVIALMVVCAMAGGGIGLLLAKLLGDKYIRFFQKQVDRGGLLLWVNTPNADSEVRAQAILTKNGASDVHVHNIPSDEALDNDEPMEPSVFGSAFVRLDQIANSHHHILEQDHMMADKLHYVMDMLKVTADQDNQVSPEATQRIVEKIEEVSCYAEDMAEEEQRIVAESHASAQGNEEEEAEEYFSLAQELSEFAHNYRDVMIHHKAA